MYGVSAGVTSLAKSVGSALAGVVTKPMEGAEKEGFGGFFKGIGKGLVGVVAKPMVGLFDAASNVAEGIKNTTTVFENEIDRVRLPRRIGIDGILTAYDPRDAIGLYWLKSLEDGKFFHEDYVAHLELRIEDCVLLATKTRILYIRVKKLKFEWEVQYNDLQTVKLVNNNELVFTKKINHYQEISERRVPVLDESAAVWFVAQVDLALNRWAEKNRPVD